MLNPDKAGDDLTKDELGYRGISEQIANSICQMAPPDGFVMALYGRWGSGKSTVLNYIESLIAKAPLEIRPAVVRFNPWWFSGHEDLAKLCLLQIADTLESDSKYLKKASKFIKQIANTVADSPIPLNIGGLGVSFSTKDVAKGVAEHLGRSENVQELKNKVNDLIERSEQRIVVFIDDIDRLSADEIRQLFRVVKAIGDFRNVVYLLAFDREVVACALNSVQGISGSEYLEKIVQVPFALPMPTSHGLRKMFFSQVDEIVSPDEKTFDQNYFFNMMLSGVLHFLQTPRAVLRLSNALRASYPPVKFEINASDFIAVEAIRVFCPNIYDMVRKNKSSFAGHSERDDYSSRLAGELKEFHSKLLEKVPVDDREPLKELLIRLFPKLGAVWGGSSYGADFVSGWTREKRVCSPEKFDVYFSSGLPEGVLSQSEFDRLLATVQSADEFGNLLVEFSKRLTPQGKTLIPQILDRLTEDCKSLPKEQIPNILQAFINVGDLIIVQADQSQGILDLSTDWRIGSLFTSLTEHLDEPDRFIQLKQILTYPTSLQTAINFVRQLEHEHGKYGSQGKVDQLIAIEQVEELEKITLETVRAAIESKSEAVVPAILKTMFFCKENLQVEEFSKLKSKTLKIPKYVLALLKACQQIQFVHSMGDKVSKRVSKINLTNLKDIFSFKELQSSITRNRAELEQLDLAFMKEIDAALSQKTRSRTI